MGGISVVGTVRNLWRIITIGGMDWIAVLLLVPCVVSRVSSFALRFAARGLHLQAAGAAARERGAETQIKRAFYFSK